MIKIGYALYVSRTDGDYIEIIEGEGAVGEKQCSLKMETEEKWGC